jgi:plastocyanin
VKPRHVTASLALLAAVAGPVAGCGGSSSSSNASQSTKPAQGSSSGGGSGGVSIDNFKFSPASLTVKSGTKVTVANHDSTAHTTTADNGKSFDTGSIDPGASSTITVSKAGTYKYHCSIHPFMHGTLVVK